MTIIPLHMPSKNYIGHLRFKSILGIIINRYARFCTCNSHPLAVIPHESTVNIGCSLNQMNCEHKDGCCFLCQIPGMSQPDVWSWVCKTIHALAWLGNPSTGSIWSDERWLSWLARAVDIHSGYRTVSTSARKTRQWWGEALSASTAEVVRGRWIWPGVWQLAWAGGLVSQICRWRLADVSGSHAVVSRDVNWSGLF